MASTDAIRELLTGARTIAVVGLSDDQSRPSYGVAAYLQRKGYTIVPVNPHLRRPVLGEQPYPSLAAVPQPIDIVDLFRRPEYVPDLVDEAIAVGAKAVWMQLGVGHSGAAAKAEAAGLRVVMDRCIAVEHRMLVG